MVFISKTLLALVFAIGAVPSASFNVNVSIDESRVLYGSSNQYATAMLAQVNKQRAIKGLDPLCMNNKLTAASQRHSNDMAAKNFMSHTGSDGSTMVKRVTASGYKWTKLAENVAAGQSSVDTVMAAWMKSSGHRANILGDYTMFGTAYAYGSATKYKHYWTQNFGSSTTEKCNGNAENMETPPPSMNETAESTGNASVVLPNELPPVENACATTSY